MIDKDVKTFRTCKLTKKVYPIFKGFSAAKSFKMHMSDIKKIRMKKQNTIFGDSGSEDDARTNKPNESQTSSTDMRQKFSDFVDSVSNMQDKSKVSKRKFKIGKISKKHAELIEPLMKEIKPDFSADDYDVWIDGTAVQHIELRHGQKGSADRSMASSCDKDAIISVLDNPDDATFLRDTEGNIERSNRFANAVGVAAPILQLKKKTTQGNIYITECVVDSKDRKISVISTYINKK